MVDGDRLFVEATADGETERDAVQSIGRVISAVAKKPSLLDIPLRKGKRAKISDDQKDAIIAEYKNGVKVSEICRRFKISNPTVYGIIKRVPKPTKSKGDSLRDSRERPRMFKCGDAIDCGVTFKKNTGEHVAACPKCGSSAYEIDEQ